MLFHLLKICIVASLFLPASFCRSQDLSELKNFTIDPAEIKFSIVSWAALPLRSIKIIDARYDTSTLGYGLFGRVQKSISLKGGSSAMERLMNQQFKFSKHSGQDLVIVVRSLWLHEIKSGEKYPEDYANEKFNISECLVKLDLYAATDSIFQALVRIDTVFENKSPLKNIAPQLLTAVFQQTVNCMEALDLRQKLIQKRKLPAAEVNNFYMSRFEKPRIRRDSLQRGIYLTFDDFIQNRPANYTFFLEEDRQADYLYIEEKGEKKLFTDFWGFCDGRHHFIRIGYNFFKLTRTGNSFSFWGCLQAIHNNVPKGEKRVARYMIFGVFGEMHNNRLINMLRPMQLDMETGVAY